MPNSNAIIGVTSTAPFAWAYPFTPGTGWGTKYSDPGTLPAGTGQGMCFGKNATDVVIDHSTTPYVSAYPWSAGFGTKYSNPGTLPQTAGQGDSSFTPDGVDLVVGRSTTPFVNSYPWTPGTGFGTAYSNPASLPAASSTGVTLTDTGTDLALSNALSSPYVKAWAYTPGTGFGTARSAPGTTPGSTGNDVRFSAGSSPDIGVATTGTPFLQVYPWSAGWGTKYTNPGTLPSASNGVAFGASDVALASSLCQAYPWTVGTGFGTKYTSSAPTGFTYSDVAFSSGSTDVAAIRNTSSIGSHNMNAWPWTTGTGFGTVYSDPGTVSQGTGAGIAFATLGATSLTPWDRGVRVINRRKNV